MHQIANINDDIINKVQVSVPEIHFSIVYGNLRWFENFYYCNIVNIYIKKKKRCVLDVVFRDDKIHEIFEFQKSRKFCCEICVQTECLTVF